jgi:hypothetical protein
VELEFLEVVEGGGLEPGVQGRGAVLVAAFQYVVPGDG